VLGSRETTFGNDLSHILSHYADFVPAIIPAIIRDALELLDLFQCSSQWMDIGLEAERTAGSPVIGLTTDALRTYVNVIEDAFGGQADYAQLHKVYSAAQENETRYSPAQCVGCAMKEVSGRPDFRHVSTSFVERQNWTVRTSMRRYTRLSNGFSRKLENHAAATALNYFAYNFIKIHRTLRTSPAMAAGVTGRLWDVSDLVVLWEAYEQRRAERAA